MAITKLTSTVCWSFWSYLCCRKQYVIVEGTSSSTTSVPSGVPQGSVLGPLLFLTYISCVADLGFSDGTLVTIYTDDILFVEAHQVPQWFMSTFRQISIAFQTALKAYICHWTLPNISTSLHHERESLHYHLQDYIWMVKLWNMLGDRYLCILVTETLGLSIYSKCAERQES